MEAQLKSPPDFEYKASEPTTHPLLIIGLPEHSPIKASAFEKALLACRYQEVVSLNNHVNLLGEQANQRHRNEAGTELARAIKKTVEKPFHGAIFAKVGH